MTYHPKSEFMRVMIERGFLADCTDYQALDEAFVQGIVPAYIGFDATAKSLHAKLLHKKYAWVDAQLAHTKYLTGDTFTVADAYLFTVTGWAKHVSLDFSQLPQLQRFLADVAARPAVRDAMKAEGLLA